MTSKILAQLNDKMKELPSKQNRAHCCIYRVPKSLRNVNWKAYTPLMISIGPLHRESKRIQAMQNHKWRCFKEFTEQDGMNNDKIRDLVVIIQNEEKNIRVCYSEKFNRISSCDFIEMILLDVVFTIEFLKEYKHPKNFEPRMMFDIKEDLILLENQLPLSIIWYIYSKINPGFPDATWKHSFLDLVTYAFGKNTGGKNTAGSFLDRVNSENNQSIYGSKHFTDLVRQFMLKGSIKRSYSFDPVKLKYSAVMLRKAGVRFQVTRDKCVVNITFDRGVLKIPQLEVDHNFERLVRNIMAMEQCLYEREAYICSYIKFMDHLIDSAGDVGLLVEKGIILHWLGDDAAVSNMINNFCENIGDNYTCFGDISQELNAHYESLFNRMKATLKLVYFPNIWRGTATLAAATLLILTFIQTMWCLILQVLNLKEKAIRLVQNLFAIVLESLQKSIELYSIKR
uniref:Uncharacterized protein n=1 Tax=Salix viminalis TaxID=40686 RepID=A0A6N2M033_SALVM